MVNSNLHTLVIKAGEKVVLPKGAVIKSVGIDGDLTLSSTCENLNTVLSNAESYECYVFAYGVDADDNNSHPMDNAHLYWIEVANIQYQMDNRYLWSPLSGPITLMSHINTKMQGNHHILKVTDVWQHFDGSKRTEYKIRVKMLPSLAKTAKMHIGGNGFPHGLYLLPEPHSCT